MLYPGVKQSDLSEEQKQTISTLATVSAGLARRSYRKQHRISSSGSTERKNAVENNYLSTNQSLTFDKELSDVGNLEVTARTLLINGKKKSVMNRVQKEIEIRS